MTKGIYRFFIDGGRAGELDNLFVADSEKVAKAIGKQIYLGDVLGKHSDVGGTLEEDEITFITDDPAAVEMFEKYELYCGYNPLEYLNEIEDEE